MFSYKKICFRIKIDLSLHIKLSIMSYKTEVDIPYVIGKSISKIEVKGNIYIITLNEGTTLEFRGRGNDEYLVGTNIEVFKDTQLIFADSEWD